MVSFHLVKIAALLCTSSVVAQDDFAALTKKVMINKRKIRKNVKTIALMTTAMDDMKASHGEHALAMTKTMDDMKASYDEQIASLSSFLGYTARSCCDSSAPTSNPSKSPTDIPTKTPSYVPSSAPTQSSRPTPDCVDTYAEEISGVSDSIHAVAMYDTNHMLVGNEDDDQVELFMREYFFSNWLSVKVYEPSTPLYYSSEYGTAIALNDQHVVITSEGSYSSDTGRLFIYDRATDTETIMENPGTDSGGDLFGCSVALSGNIIVIGAKDDDTVSNKAGIAYIYEKKDGTWDLVQSIKAPDGRSYDYFGSSVAYDGNTIVVGATGAGPNSSGAAYVYRRGIGSTDYEYFSRVGPENGSSSDSFGYSVATSGGVITVGSPNSDSPSYNAGSVFFYCYNPTTDSIEFLESRNGADYGYNYGYTVAMERNRIAVTALGEHVDVFEFSGGFNPIPPNGALSDGYEVTLVGTMTGTRSSFGKFMAISGNSVIATGVPNYGYEKLYQQTICGDL